LTQRPSLFVITAVLAILTSVGPISTDMYLPAFAAMRVALGGSHGDTQMTLAAWFFGLAVGQVTWGAYADHYGRRGPLLVGTLIYTMASVGCAVSANMLEFSIFRVLAAFGAAASLVVPRAVIRDVVGNDGDAARMLGRMVLVMSIVPMLAPTLGGFIAEYWDWRGIFWIAAIYGIACLGLVYWQMPNTLRNTLHVRLNISRTVEGYLLVWRDRVFRLHALEGGFATFSLFAFLGGAPMVFLAGFHLSPPLFGSIFILNAVGYAIGTNLNGPLVARFGASRVLSGATVGFAGVTTLMLIGALAEFGALFQALAMTGCMVALGFLLPGAALGSVLPNRAAAGKASALYGTVVFFIGSISTALVGYFESDSAVPMTALMVFGALAAVACDRMRGGR